MVNKMQGPTKPETQETKETNIQANLVNTEVEDEKQAVEEGSKKTNEEILSVVSTETTPDANIQTPESEAQTETPETQTYRLLTHLLAAIPKRVEDGTATWVERSLQNLSDNCEKQGIEIENMTFLNKTKFFGLMALFIMQNRYRLR